MVVWTPNSVDSRWVRGEARDAADRGVLVPVRLQDAKLPIDFRAVHTIDLDDWGGTAQAAPSAALCKALEAKLGAKRPGRHGGGKGKARRRSASACCRSPT